MSNEKQETIADIVAEMRLGVKDWKGERLGVFDCFADRIEAAHHREVAELKSKMNDVVCENEALRDACGTCGAKREVDELRECLEQAYGDKIGTYTMKGNEIERWRKALKGAKDESK